MARWHHVITTRIPPYAAALLTREEMATIRATCEEDILLPRDTALTFGDAIYRLTRQLVGWLLPFITLI